MRKKLSKCSSSLASTLCITNWAIHSTILHLLSIHRLSKIAVLNQTAALPIFYLIPSANLIGYIQGNSSASLLIKDLTSFFGNLQKANLQNLVVPGSKVTSLVCCNQGHGIININKPGTGIRCQGSIFVLVTYVLPFRLHRKAVQTIYYS
ncbi:hypothetical protein CPB83DRAFT_187313 [Crepidotus variabilis]|uniref:Uncharacterized protein n=1 Tax=Crepidotus variabilis TaxID=179855 RepID=A0A9P6EJE4_9AGAR|nr:hypothetical protein CPB83DRAFT_187313 [Crepidotus variabilis]